MMDGIRQWLLGILAAAMGLSLLYALLPKGAVRAAAKATGGLIPVSYTHLTLPTN